MSVEFESTQLPQQLEVEETPLRRGDVSLSPVVDDADPADDYRAASTPAIAGLALGVLSPLALVDWWLGLIPLAAIVLSIAGIRQTTKWPQEFTGKWLAIAGLALGLLSFGAGQARLWMIYVNELPPGYSRVSYTELQPQRGDSPNSIPPEAIALNGKKILVKGYIYPGNRQEGITRFLLVRDQGDCCFGGNPKITDRIQVTLTDPKGCRFHSGLFKVAGTFRIQPVGDAVDANGMVFYHLDGAQLR
jgi:hypothetical protein